MSTCATEVDFCITRGTSWSTSVSFTNAFTELLEDPDAYEGVLVFREYQDDDAQVYLTLRADIYTDDPKVPASMTFTATPEQTLTLPDWNNVAYCNLQKRDLTEIMRLYDASVEMNE